MRELREIIVWWGYCINRKCIRDGSQAPVGGNVCGRRRNMGSGAGVLSHARTFDIALWSETAAGSIWKRDRHVRLELRPQPMGVG
jgi:hypothetical protein